MKRNYRNWREKAVRNYSFRSIYFIWSILWIAALICFNFFNIFHPFTFYMCYERVNSESSTFFCTKCKPTIFTVVLCYRKYSELNSEYASLQIDSFLHNTFCSNCWHISSQNCIACFVSNCLPVDMKQRQNLIGILFTQYWICSQANTIHIHCTARTLIRLAVFRFGSDENVSIRSSILNLCSVCILELKIYSIIHPNGEFTIIIPFHLFLCSSLSFILPK